MALRSLGLWATLTLFVALVASLDVTDIQGPAFLSPYAGQTVHNVTGVVTAKVRFAHPRLPNELILYRPGPKRVLYYWYALAEPCNF